MSTWSPKLKRFLTVERWSPEKTRKINQYLATWGRILFLAILATIPTWLFLNIYLTERLTTRVQEVEQRLKVMQLECTCHKQRGGPR